MLIYNIRQIKNVNVSLGEASNSFKDTHLVGSAASISTRPVWLQNGLNTQWRQYSNIVIVISPSFVTC